MLLSLQSECLIIILNKFTLFMWPDQLRDAPHPVTMAQIWQGVTHKRDTQDKEQLRSPEAPTTAIGTEPPKFFPTPLGIFTSELLF